MADITPTNPQGAGRPKLTPEEIASRKKEVVRKIEPYLKSGLSIRKALAQAKIVRSEFYEYMRDDEDFRDQINEFRDFVAVLANNAIINHLMTITGKQNPTNGKKAQALSKEEVKFLEWFVLNSNLTKDEFGERKKIDLFDPEAEIQKVKALLEGRTTKEVVHDDLDLLDE